MGSYDLEMSVNPTSALHVDLAKVCVLIMICDVSFDCLCAWLKHHISRPIFAQACVWHVCVLGCLDVHGDVVMVLW